MEMPTKDDQRQFNPVQGNLSQTAEMFQETANTYDKLTNVFTGFTDAMMGKYAKQLEEDGRKQAMIDAYNNSKEGKMQPIEHDGFTTFSRGYEDMSKKIFASQMKMEVDNVAYETALRYENDPIGFGQEMQLYMQKAEEKIPEEMREAWRQELIGTSTLHMRKLKEGNEKMLREEYAGQFVQTARLLETQGLQYANDRVEGMIDKNLQEYDTMIEQAVADKIFTPAQGEKLKLSHRAGVGETYIMSAFDDALKTDLKTAIAFKEKFAETSTLADRSGGSRSWRNKNPGNHKYGDFAKKMGAIGQDKDGFAIYPSEKAGLIAQKALLRGGKYANLDMVQMIDKYSPEEDNNDTVAYVKSLVKKTGLDPNRKMSDLSDSEMDDLLIAMRTHEGWKEGTVNSPWEYTVEERDAMTKKMEVAIKAKVTADKSAKGVQKSVNNRNLKDATKIFEDGGDVPQETVGQLDVISIDDASVENVANYRLARAFAPNVKQFNQAPLLAQEARIIELRNKKERLPEEQYLLDTYEKNYKKNQEAISKDPVTHYSTKIEKDSFKPLDFSSSDALANSFKQRAIVAQGIQDTLKRSPLYLTDNEATELANSFTGINGNWGEMANFAYTANKALGEDAKHIFMQMSEKGAHQLSMIGFMTNRGDPMSVQYIDKVQKGMELIYGPEKIEGIVPKTFNEDYNKKVGNTLSAVPAHLQKAYGETVKAIMASEVNDLGVAGQENVSLSDHMDKAIEAVFGGKPFTVNSQMIIPPWRGATFDNFEDKLKSVMKEHPDQFEGVSPNMKKTLEKEFSKDLSKTWGLFGESTSLQYRSAGEGQYFVLDGNGRNIPYTDKNGKQRALVIKLEK